MPYAEPKSDVSRVIDLAETAIAATKDAARAEGQREYWERWGKRLSRDVLAWAEANLEGDKLEAFIELVNER